MTAHEHLWMFLRNEPLGLQAQLMFPAASGFRRYYCQMCLIETTRLHYDPPANP